MPSRWVRRWPITSPKNMCGCASTRRGIPSAFISTSSGRGVSGAGRTFLGAIELWAVLMTGITARQIANDPGRDRYAHHVDSLVDLYLAHVLPDEKRKTSRS